MSVIRLGYVHLRVTDLEEARNHYENTMGMDAVHVEDGRVYLKSWDEDDHHSIVIEEGGVGLSRIGYKVDGERSLDEIEARLPDFGVSYERMAKGETPGVGEGLRITMPSDHVLELYHDIEYVGTRVGKLNPDPWPREGLRGIGVPRINHALITTEDPLLLERFFADVLDFRPAERLVAGDPDSDLVGSWMFCGEQPHDIAFVKGAQGKFHHVAFEVDDWSALLRATDVMSMDAVPIDFGPARHGITRGGTVYFFDSSGNRNEVFSGGYLAYPDRPVNVWTPEALGKGVFYHARELNDAFTSVLT